MVGGMGERGSARAKRENEEGGTHSIERRLDSKLADLLERELKEVGEVLEAGVGTVEVADVEVLLPLGERVVL
jgi:hypothetical protein